MPRTVPGAAGVSVFAVADAHVAATMLPVSRTEEAQPRLDKGYIYTDRPVYCPGHTVHVRGCLHRATTPGTAPGDAHVIDSGKYTLEVLDSRSRPVWNQQVRLGPFGTFSASFALPGASPAGEYRIAVHDRAGRNFQGSFTVRGYQTEPVRLAIDMPRRVFCRGEQIEGTIRATYDYGAPLAGSPITYRLADDRQYTAQTDARGEVHFKLSTRDFAESQVLPLVAALPERNLETAIHLLLAVRDLAIELHTVRPVFLSGEPFEVTLKASDARGKPLAAKLVLKVLERTVVEGKVAERQVLQHPLETGADGSVRDSVRLDPAGHYVLRAEGIDRFKNAAWGQAEVEISGQDDQVRLRILAERHTYKLGDTAEVKVHWREEPALALLTLEGSQVMEYRLIELKPGLNMLAIPMTEPLVPNFELALAAMTDARPAKGPKDKPVLPRLHTAASPFAVQQQLHVELAVRPAGAQAGGAGKGDRPLLPERPFGCFAQKGPVPFSHPGEPVEVVVTTTDPQGKPVAAELSLAMVRQSLLDRFDWPMPPIQQFFCPAQRRPAVLTASSIAFSYQPPTEPINPRLLAESERLELAVEEQASLAAARAGRGNLASPGRRGA